MTGTTLLSPPSSPETGTKAKPQPSAKPPAPIVLLRTQQWSSWPDFAGSTWVPMQYLLGFLRLGVDAFWVDQLNHVDPLKDAHSFDYLMHRFDSTAREFGFQDRYCVVYESGRQYFGLSRERVTELASKADLLLSISGKGLPKGLPFLEIPRRAYVDVDPGFTQLWALHGDMGLQQFNYFFTVGQCVGLPCFRIPTQGIEWRRILPPVVLDLWPPRIDENCSRFSTVADWWGSQHIRYEGELYGGKRDEFLRFAEVPRRARQKVEIALAIYPEDHKELGLLNRNLWKIKNPYMHAGDPHSYREFIQFSRGEFSVAKGGYVKSRSGWISDRTACYLASGKPVLVQSTELEECLPTGTGLLTFRTVDEALAGFEKIDSDYRSHCDAALDLARKHFDSDTVLRSILEQVGL